MKTLKIFLASSNELQPEREMMASLANSLNTVLEKQGVNVIVVQWENLDASMGVNHKQEDYNEKLRECDMCMVLYWTKFGMYTKIELETAFNELKAGHNPKKVYVYFKEDESTVAEELKEFRDSFPTRYGHFYTPFSNFDTLKAHFLLQFMEYQSQVLPEGRGVEVRNGKVTIDGTDYVDLKNVPFAGNNEEYQLLQKNIKKTQKLLAITETDDPDYSEYAKDLNEMKEKLAKMESSLWDTALMITRLSTTKCSERLKRAMQLFNKGDNKGALAVLNEEEIEKDAQHNINLIKLGEAGKEGLQTNIKEYEMRISSLQNEMNPGWLQEIITLREKILEWTKILFGTESVEYAEAMTELGHFLSLNGNYSQALDYQLKALSIRKEALGEKHPSTAGSYNKIANVYYDLGDYEKALDYHLKALSIRKEALGEKHPDTASSYNNIGLVYIEFAEYEKALDYQLKALSIRKEVLGEKHPDTASSYNNIAKVYYKPAEYEKALDYLLKSLPIIKEVLGEKHPYTATSYNNIANVYNKLGEYEKALDYFLKALSIRKELFGENHPYTDVLYRNLGLIYYRISDLDKAEFYYEKLALRRNFKVWDMLSYIYFRKGMHDKALDAIDKALALEPLNPHCLDTKGEHLFNLGRYDEAREMWLEVIKSDPEFDKHVDSALFKGLKRKGLI